MNNSNLIRKKVLIIIGIVLGILLIIFMLIFDRQQAGNKNKNKINISVTSSPTPGRKRLKLPLDENDPSLWIDENGKRIEGDWN